MRTARSHVLEHVPGHIVPDADQLTAQHRAKCIVLFLHRHLRVRTSWHVTVDAAVFRIAAGLYHNATVFRLVALKTSLDKECGVASFLLMRIVAGDALHFAAFLVAATQGQPSLLIR